MPSTVELIAKKRDGRVLSPEEIAWLVDGFTHDRVADYQMSAWLMAAWLKGLNPHETLALTDAMLNSGRVLELASVKQPKVDKHSTGGVGDKISLSLAPLVAACGVAVPMIAGRGLGHTGGTLDKLEAIPGFKVQQSARRFEQILRNVGVAIIGQTPELAPADRRMYALRDVTGTVESIPLIVASILSKKLAEGIDALVLDVKVGRGAFMKTTRDARRLAKALVATCARSNKRAVALMTDMSRPIGRTIGNALEVREAIDVLHGGGPPDTRELTLALGAEMLRLAGKAKSLAAARRTLEAALRSGAAFETFVRMVEAQGGDARAVRDPGRLPRSKRTVDIAASKAGYVVDIDPLELGLVAVALGAGRQRAEDPVDPAAGIELLSEPGQRVSRGEPIARLHLGRRRVDSDLLRRAERAFSFAARDRAPGKLVLLRIGA